MLPSCFQEDVGVNVRREPQNLWYTFLKFNYATFFKFHYATFWMLPSSKV